MLIPVLDRPSRPLPQPAHLEPGHRPGERRAVLTQQLPSGPYLSARLHLRQGLHGWEAQLQEHRFAHYRGRIVASVEELLVGPNASYADAEQRYLAAIEAKAQDHFQLSFEGEPR